MERLHYRSTSLVDLQAELHQRDLLRGLTGHRHDAVPPHRERARRFGLTLLGRRIGG